MTSERRVIRIQAGSLQITKETNIFILEAIIDVLGRSRTMADSVIVHADYHINDLVRHINANLKGIYRGRNGV